MRKAFLKNFGAEEKEAEKLREGRSELAGHCRMYAMKRSGGRDLAGSATVF
ncbi:hypothetical protein GGD54_003534 [Rhizobium tropici]|uniref:Uncharacterized protein n=1 Tax=Rhizobium tropici TaxID=398 RepID=A0ABR6R1P5_RHITR|nr:hypothetical protein [Rhizobium tropici]MBB5594310.1 hypothetical protein [Rhizobium tropici]MBB6493110.1 hypothetical protein [Rhizobium tropici]